MITTYADSCRIANTRVVVTKLNTHHAHHHNLLILHELYFCMHGRLIKKETRSTENIKVIVTHGANICIQLYMYSKRECCNKNLTPLG